ncbi:MAG: hypothetical protein GJ677_00830 [Rhodobacteraceae bacterium]|nr:hypothetical protein [Paracoccaceae bacterium]
MIREILWSIGLIESEFETVVQYLQMKQDAALQAENGNFAQVEDIVDHYLKANPWSLTVLSQKVFLVSSRRGLEAQREWLNNEVYSHGSSPSAIFSYWFGLRSEPGVDPLVFERDFREGVLNDTFTATETSFLEFFFLGAMPQEEDEAALLRSTQNQSIIDQYEALTSLCIHAACDNRASAKTYFETVFPFMRRLNDPRTEKLGVILGHGPSVENAKLSLVAETLSGYRSKAHELENWSAGQAISHLRLTHNQEFPKAAGGPAHFKKTIMSAISNRQLNAEDRECLKTSLFASSHSAQSQFALSSLRLKNATSPKEFRTWNLYRFLYDKEFDLALATNLHPIVFTYLFGDVREGKEDVLDTLVYFAKQQAEASQIERFDNTCRFATSWKQLDGELIRLQLLTAVHGGEIECALKDFRKFAVSSEIALEWVPFEQLSAAIDDAIVCSISHDPEIPLSLALLAPKMGERIQSLLLYSIECYLSGFDAIKPSDLKAETILRTNLMAEVLFECCTIDSLSLSLFYQSSEDVESERLELLRLVADTTAHLKEKAEKEIAQIIRSQEINRAIDTLQIGKISCDETQLRNWANSALKPKFDRLRSYIDIGVLPSRPGYSKDLLAAIREGQSQADLFEVPSNEAYSVANSLIDELISRYSFDPQHGLDSFLSLRIRHGTVSGQLRRPCAEEYLLTAACSEGDGYEQNSHWGNHLSAFMTSEMANDISFVLARFSQKYDVYIQRFTDERVQILSSSRERGLIATQFNQIVKLGFLDDIVDTEEFEDFLESFSILFWSNLNNSLETARDTIDTEIRAGFEAIFKELSEELKEISRSQSVPLLSDAIIRAQQNLNRSIDEMLSWFQVSQTPDSKPIAVNDLVGISLETVKRLNPGFHPRLSVSGDDDYRLLSALFTFTDVFFVLFDNVVKHSGHSTPLINITIGVGEEGVLEMLFSSQCKDVASQSEAVKTVNERIASGDYASRVSKEGGTGLSKIAKIMSSSSLNEPMKVWLNVDESTFNVFLSFSFFEIATDRKPDQGRLL